MESFLTHITNYLLTQSWQIALLTIVVAFISFLLKNRSAHIRYLLWMIVLAKCIVPPFYNIPLAVLPEQKQAVYTPSEPAVENMTYYSLPEVITSETPLPTSVIPDSIAQEEDSQSINADSKASYNTRALLAIIWLAGTAVFVFYYLLNTLHTELWLLKNRKELPEQYKKNIERLFDDYGVKKMPRIWVLERINQPFVWGLVRGSIYLPSVIVDKKNAKFHKSLLGHELSHVIRLDALINSLQIITQTIFWFHPFIWWTNRKIRIEREKCCDEMTIARQNALPEDYSEAIVEILAAKYEQARRISSLAVSGRFKNIEERIKIIMKPEKRFYQKPSFKVAVIVLIFASFIIPTTFDLTVRGSTGDSAGINDDSNVEPANVISDISPTPKLDNPAKWTPNTNGCFIEQTGSKIHIVGTTNINGWGHCNGIESTKVIPNGNFYACVDFMVPRFNGPGSALVYLRAKSATGNGRMVAILFQPNAGVYLVQGWNAEGNIFGGVLPNFGDEDKVYHRMKLKYDAATKTAFGWIDDKFIGYLNYPLTDSIKFDLLANTETRGMQIDLFFDNLYVSPDISEAPPVPASASLLVAVTSGDIDKVKLLISEKIDQDAKNKALQEACSEGYLDIVKLLVDNGADINSSGQNRDTPLGFAVDGGHLKVTEFLITQGADVNAKNIVGQSILFTACQRGDEEIVNLLIDNGADVNAINNAGLTPLDASKQSNHTEIVELLLKHGAKKTLSWFVAIEDIEQVKLLILEETNPNAKNAALQEACYVDNLDIMKLLIDNGADVNAKNKGGGTVLTTAAAAGNKEMIELLIERGADINTSNNWGWTALLSVASNGYIDILEFLIANGADINAQIAKGHTALELAQQEGHVKVVELLRKHGVKEKPSSGENSTDTTNALCKAAVAGDIKLVQSLILQGANINEKNNTGYTALHSASTNGRKEVAKLLIEKGADIKVKDNIGNTPLHFAVGRGNEDVITLLLNSGADINIKNYSGRIPLMDAVSSRNKSIVELLILKGADINAKNNFGFSSLDMAENRGYPEIVELLQEHRANISPDPKLDDPTSWIPKANGCFIEQTGSKIHIVGTSKIADWDHANGITSTKILPEGDFYACVDFMVPRFSGPGSTLVYLRANSATGNDKMVVLVFKPNTGIYQVQGRSGDGNIFSNTLNSFGDEDKAYHRMKLIYDAAIKTAFGWVDDQFIGYINYPLTGPIKFDLLANTKTRDMQIDIFFDNLSISTDISKAPPIPAFAYLPVAVTCGDIEQVKLIISEGIDQDAKNKALQEACSVGYLDIVKLLIDNGADINAKDISDRFPLDIAKQEGNNEIIEFLKKQGATE